MTKSKKQTVLKEKLPSEDPSTYYDGYYTDNSDGVPYVIKTCSNGAKKWIKKEETPPKVASVASAASADYDDAVLKDDEASLHSASSSSDDDADDEVEEVPPSKKKPTSKDITLQMKKVSVKEGKKPVVPADSSSEESPVKKSVVQNKTTPKKQSVPKIINLVEDHKKVEEPVPAPKPKPKRKLTTYNIFVSVKLPEIHKKLPNLPNREYMTRVAALWQTLSDDEKKNYKAPLKKPSASA